MFFERGLAMPGPSEVSQTAATLCRLQLRKVLGSYLFQKIRSTALS